MKLLSYLFENNDSVGWTYIHNRYKVSVPYNKTSIMHSVMNIIIVPFVEFFMENVPF